MKKAWDYMSGFGIAFAVFSWIQEVWVGLELGGVLPFWAKGALAVIFGFLAAHIYRLQN